MAMSANSYKLIDYCIIEDCCPEEFSNLIMDKINEEWFLYGNHCASPYIEEGKNLILYSQAMVKYER